jgi:1-acyl-sn-glycerol-3-phosphate acyltransferase
VIWLRSAAFTAWMYGLLLVMGVLWIPTLLMPRRSLRGGMRLWNRLVVGGLRVLCGVRVEFRGLEHRPQGPALIAAKHQSQLDTIVPFLVLSDPAFVLKQELLKLPIFGWYAKKSAMIAVDREGHAKALKQLVADAQNRLADGRQIIIFPEGTRQEPGAEPDYKPGVAALYRDLGLPCALLATNSGRCWPPNGLMRRPGTVVFEFLEPIPPGLKRGAFMQQLEERIEWASKALLITPPK